MSVVINNPITMTFTEELDDIPPDIFEGLTFEIAEILDKLGEAEGVVNRVLVITPFQGCQMALREEEVSSIQRALLNFLNTGYFDQEG